MWRIVITVTYRGEISMCNVLLFVSDDNTVVPPHVNSEHFMNTFHIWQPPTSSIWSGMAVAEDLNKLTTILHRPWVFVVRVETGDDDWPNRQGPRQFYTDWRIFQRFTEFETSFSSRASQRVVKHAWARLVYVGASAKYLNFNRYRYAPI